MIADMEEPTTKGGSILGTTVHPPLIRWITGTILLFASQAFTQDQGLYDPEPPPNAAFVRTVQANSGADAFDLTLRDVGLDPVSYGEVSPYRVLVQGTYDLAGTDPLVIEAGRFYTVASTPTGIVVLEDATNSDRAKALLVFYNFSDLPSLDLKTADGSVPVITDVHPQQSGNVQVNPIAIGFGLFDDATQLALIDDPGLQRGAAFGFFVFGSSEDLRVEVVIAETRTE